MMKRVLIFLLFTFLLLLASCTKLESAGFEVGEKLGKKLVGDETNEHPDDDGLFGEAENKLQDPYCLTVAENLLQDNVALLRIGKEWYLKEYTFTNGKLDSTLSIRYRPGEKDGENVRYMYPSNLIESNYVRYTQQQIAEDGVIKGDFTFKVRLILEKTSDDIQLLNDTLYGREIESQNYVVVEQEIKNCVMP